MKNKNLLLGVAFATSLMFTACSKTEVGPTGATGPAGVNGTNGTNGTNGVDGTNGLDGKDATAKQFELTIKPSEWSWNSTYNTWEAKFYTSNWSNASAVYGYVMTGQGQVALPYYKYSDKTTISFSKNLFEATPYILITYENGTNSIAKPTSNTLIYLVYISGSYARIDNSKVDFSNYNEVKTYYGIK